MEFEISFAGVGLILLDALMLWACWMVRRHLALIEDEEERSEQEDVRYLQRLLVLIGDRPNRDDGDLNVSDRFP